MTIIYSAYSVYADGKTKGIRWDLVVIKLLTHFFILHICLSNGVQLQKKKEKKKFPSSLYTPWKYLRENHINIEIRSTKRFG